MNSFDGDRALPERSSAYRAVSGLTSAIAGVFVVLDMAIGPVLHPVVRIIAASRLVGLLRDFSQRLPAYVALAFLAVPLAIAEPAKIYALYLIGDGRYVSGLVVLAAAYLISIFLIDTIYEGARPQLRSIAPFAAAVDWMSAIRSKVVGAVRASRPYAIARKQVLRVRAWFGRRFARAAARKRTT